jgi:hypothetical protein
LTSGGTATAKDATGKRCVSFDACLFRYNHNPAMRRTVSIAVHCPGIANAIIFTTSSNLLKNEQPH